MEIKREISLDISKQGVQGKINLTQHEEGITKIEFSLTDGLDAITINRDSHTATLYIDTLDVLEQAEISADNRRIVYEVTSAATRLVGDFNAVLQVVSNDNGTYYSPQFQVSVKKDITTMSQVVDSSPFAAVIQAREAAKNYLEEFEDKIQGDANAEALEGIQSEVDALRLSFQNQSNKVQTIYDKLATVDIGKLPEGSVVTSAEIKPAKLEDSDTENTSCLEVTTSAGDTFVSECIDSTARNKLEHAVMGLHIGETHDDEYYGKLHFHTGDRAGPWTDFEIVDATARENNNKNYAQILGRVVKVEEKDGKLNLFYVNPKYGEPDEPQYLERESSEVVDKHIRTYAITTLFVDKELGKLKYADGKEEFEQEIVDKKARGAVKNIDIGNNPQSFNYGKLYYSSVDGTQGEGYQEIVDATARQNVGDLQTSVGKIDKVLNGSGGGATDGLIGKTDDLESRISALSSVTRFIGTSDRLPGNGRDGDIVIVGNKEYVYDSNTNTGVDGTKWVELGDTTALSQAVDTISKDVRTINENAVSSIDVTKDGKLHYAFLDGEQGPGLQEIIDKKARDDIAPYTSLAVRKGAGDRSIIGNNYFPVPQFDEDGTPFVALCEATGPDANAFGWGTKAKGNYSSSRGCLTQAIGDGSTSDGYKSISDGDNSHAEGERTHSIGDASHSEGLETESIGQASHSEGLYTKSNGRGAHSEGADTHAVGPFSHAEGEGTYAWHQNQHVAGRYNVADKEKDKDKAHILGGGTKGNRKDIHDIDWDGNARFAGSITLDMNGSPVTITATELQALLGLIK